MESPPPRPSSPSPPPPPPRRRPSGLSLAVGQERQPSVEASARSGKRPRSPTPERPAKRRRRVSALSVAVTRPIRGRKASGSGASLKKASAKLGQRKPRWKAGMRPVKLVLRRPTGFVTQQRHQQWRPRNTIRTFIAQRLPPISDIGEIFDDMTEKAWGQLGLEEATRTLANRTINVATMCSGTESPLLAMDMTNECKSEDFAKYFLTSLKSSSLGPHSWWSQVELQASLQRRDRPVQASLHRAELCTRLRLSRHSAVGARLEGVSPILPLL